MKKRYHRWRKTRVLYYNSWNFSAEVGDLMVMPDGTFYRLVESRGKNKRAAGELTTVKITPPIPDAKAKIEGGEVFWVW